MTRIQIIERQAAIKWFNSGKPGKRRQVYYRSPQSGGWSLISYPTWRISHLYTAADDFKFLRMSHLDGETILARPIYSESGWRILKEPKFVRGFEYKSANSKLVYSYGKEIYGLGGKISAVVEQVKSATKPESVWDVLLNTVLYTRNGYTMGNALVIGRDITDSVRYHIITDYGNTLWLTKDVIKKHFHIGSVATDTHKNFRG